MLILEQKNIKKQKDRKRIKEKGSVHFSPKIHFNSPWEVGGGRQGQGSSLGVLLRITTITLQLKQKPNATCELAGTSDLTSTKHSRKQRRPGISVALNAQTKAAAGIANGQCGGCWLEHGD